VTELQTEEDKLPRDGSTARFAGHLSVPISVEHGIEHCLTKPHQATEQLVPPR